MTTYTILVDNVPTIEKLIARLNRKATKHGLSPLALTFGARSTRKDGAEILRLVDVTVQGTTPRINGWEFVATLDHAGEAGNILRTVPTFVGTIPTAYRTASPACDHCKTNRRTLLYHWYLL